MKIVKIFIIAVGLTLFASYSLLANEFEAEFQAEIEERFGTMPALNYQDPLLNTFVTGMIGMMIAQESWSEALGNKELSENIRAQRLALEKGKKIGGKKIKKIQAYNLEFEQTLQSSLQEERQLKKDKKDLMLKGVIPYFIGGQQLHFTVERLPDYMKVLEDDVKDAANMSINMNPFAKVEQVKKVKRKLKAVKTLTKNVKPYLKTTISNTQMILKFLQKNDIKVPPELQVANDIGNLEL